MSASHESSAPVREGDVLASKYRVEKVLGIGGMGVVVAAHHLELDERVALKFLLPAAAANTELVERFLREARASVRLKGAHVAKTLDVGRLADNCPYIVMEYLEGHDLHVEIRNGAGNLPITTAISYVLQAAEGLAEAHSRGIVHRDLKPGNLFLTRGVDGHPLVKVLDFGISKTLDTGVGGEGLSLTRTEMLLGSPLYMSPEQMRSSKSVDERSDLWALGAIAYELITGKVPFEAETILELCFKVAQESPVSPQAVRADVPAELAAAILRCLEKLPEDRFANVSELARAFEPFGLTRDRGTADRMHDVLGTGKRKPRASTPSLPEIDSLAPPPAVSAPPEPAPQAWGNTQSQSKPKSRKGVYIAAVAAAFVIVAVIGGAAALRSRPMTTALVATSAPAAIGLPSPAVAAITATAAATTTADADAAIAVAPPIVVAKPHPAAPNKPLVAITPPKSAKPAVSAAPPPPPGDFIKVRE